MGDFGIDKAIATSIKRKLPEMLLHCVTLCHENI